ncbi:MAG: aquaporin family protein [Tepidisphaera sp.]|nr:aquaporin family protein [Tepidisphaera sp.]
MTTDTSPTPARLPWPEYLIEGVLLGLFMVSACVAVALLSHPQSPLSRDMPNPLAQRATIGVLMGLTAIGLIYSPWGKRSGAHMNPAVTIAFMALGKVSRRDAAFYVLSQFVGGAMGVLFSSLLLGSWIESPSVDWVVTVPGPWGVTTAFMGEVGISFAIFFTVLFASNRPRLAPYTGMFAGALLAMFIAFESPLSGTSLNPARTVASAIFAGNYTALWLYFVAPIGAMLLAAAVYSVAFGPRCVRCAKLCHSHSVRCIFDCAWCRHEPDTARASRLPEPETQPR